MKDGKFIVRMCDVERRYCKVCRKQRQAVVHDALPNEEYGVTIIAQTLILRCFGLSFDKIRELFVDLYDMPIAPSTLSQLCNRATREMRSLYDETHEEIQNSDMVGGDETGWFINEKHHWVWTFVTTHSVLFLIADTRSSMISQAMLAKFVGILLSNSFGAWNNLGIDQQKCLLHYFRNMFQTLEKSNNTEFVQFYDILHSILDDARDMYEMYPHGIAPKYLIDELQERVQKLIDGSYADDDCNRFVKRLKREKDALFKFLEYRTPYHNNASERALRSKRRKYPYSNPHCRH